MEWTKQRLAELLPAAEALSAAPSEAAPKGWVARVKGVKSVTGEVRCAVLCFAGCAMLCCAALCTDCAVRCCDVLWTAGCRTVAPRCKEGVMVMCC